MKRLAHVVLLALPLSSLACPGPQKPPPLPPVAPEATAPAAPETPVVVRASKSGLGFRITEVDGTTSAPASRLAKGVALSAADEKRLLDRLAPLEEPPAWSGRS